jgi:hypothetical protein
MSDPIDPKHYNQLAIQPRDYITKNNLGYNEGNIVKYISRWRFKEGLVDLKKAQNYINYLIKLVEEHQQKKTQPKKNNSKLKYSKWPIRFGIRPNWNIDVMLKEFKQEQVIEIIGRKAWDELNKKKKKKPANVIDFKKDPKK